MLLPHCLLLLASLVPPALGSWGVSYPQSLQASGGSCLVVPCTFSYPEGVTTADGIVAIWYKDYDGQRTLVFHSATPQDVDPHFGGRAQLLGDPTARNCTLLLRGVTPGDSGPYRFRFEIVNGDRWSASRDVALSVSADLERPGVTRSEELTEGQRSTLECSTPYVCPGGDIVLHWEGYDPRGSEVSGRVQLDTSGVSQWVNLTSSFSWKDHGKKLLCEVSAGPRRASTEVVLRVRRTWGGDRGHLCHGHHVPLLPPPPSPQRFPPVSPSPFLLLGHICPLGATSCHDPLNASGSRDGSFDPRVQKRLRFCSAEGSNAVYHTPKDTQVSLSPSSGNIGVGDNVTLSCRVGSSHPPVSGYHWYKDGVAVGTERVLALRGVRRQDHGRYHCEAQNALGAGVSPPVTLHVFSAEISASPAAEVREGTATTLSCDVPGREGHPEELSYTWYKNSAWLKEGPAHTLLFPAVAAADAGYYSCQVTNSRGSDTACSPPWPPRTPATTPAKLAGATLPIPGSAQGQLGWRLEPPWHRSVPAHGTSWHLMSPPGFSLRPHPDLHALSHPTDPPRIPTLTLFQETQGGRLVIVRCTVDSHPPATLAIHRDGTVLATSGAQVATLGRRLAVTASRNSLRLEMRDAGPRESGNYGCTASNVHGNASATKVLEIRPAGLLVQPSAEVTEGTAVTLTCVGTGDTAEEPLYAWYRNGRRLQEGSFPTLEFPSVRGDDAGTFQCQVRSRNGTDTSEAVPLRVFYPPRRPVLSSFLQSQGGRLGIIQCSVESDPESNLTLQRGDNVIACTQGCPQATTSPRVQVTRSYNSLKVEIRDVVVEDEGIYVCRVKNSRGSASSTVDFKADTANVTVSPSPRVLEGDNATLTCHLSSGSTAVPNVTWYHNGQQIPEGSATSLVLRPVASRDAGLYRCRASTAGGSRSSPDVLLDVLYPPRDPLLTAFLEAERGSLAIIQCSVASNPPAQLALLRDQEPVATSAGGSSPRVTVSAAPNSLRVEIREVTPADDGSYRCTATNAHGSAERRLHLRVQATRVLISPSSEVLEGDNVSLMCQVAGEPPGDTVYSWYKDSKWLQEGPDSVLVLSHVTSAATGLYHCRARGTAGSSVSPAVTLSVCSARVWIRPSPAVREGDNATLTCAVAGGDQDVLSYTWYRNQVWLGTGSSQNLTFPAVTASDAGSYQCSVQTPAWNHSATPATLSVLYPPRNLRLRSFGGGLRSFVESSRGAATILLCAVDSHPPARLTLLRGGHPLASSPPGAGDTPRQVTSPSPNALRLELREASEEDEGEYECQARSALGVTHASLTLRVQATRVLVRPSAEVAEGTEVTLTCQAPHAQPGALYTWLKNGRWVTEGAEPSLALRGHRSDAGLYSCRAGRGPRAPPATLTVLCEWGDDTSGGTGGDTGPVAVSRCHPPCPLPDPPRAVSVSTFLENRSGRGAIVLCTAESHPPSRLALHHQGHLLAPSLSPAVTPGVRAVPSRNALRLELVAAGTGAGGRYVCVATNALGNATGSADLDVHTLSHLRTFQVLSGLFVAIVAVAIVALLAMKVWPRVRKSQSWSRAEDTLELRSKPDLSQMDGAS
ncbi:PREDICTED: sialoadhesin-like [Ficedula albicollis]|uniref:sialoadhesin-like n=1 Tax=Ficedula albicollis TaxID=59894 RepID=UPI0007AD7E84|nr:PREDICTED: sialoadhesin-like [Ficedula albicollis]